jgi:hypothetical protein
MCLGGLASWCVEIGFAFYCTSIGATGCGPMWCAWYESL